MRACIVLAMAGLAAAKDKQFVISPALRGVKLSPQQCSAGASTPSKDIPGNDLAQFPNVTQDVCTTKCCDNSACVAYVFLSSDAPNWGGCAPGGGSCCFLKTATGTAPTTLPTAAVVISRPPPPPPAPTPPPGPTPWPTQDPHNWDSLNQAFANAVLNIPQLPKIPLNNITVPAGPIGNITINNSWILLHNVTAGKIQSGDISIDSTENDTHVGWAVIVTNGNLTVTTNLEAYLDLLGIGSVWGQDLTINVSISTLMAFDYPRKAIDQPVTGASLASCDLTLGLSLGCVEDPTNHSSSGVCELIPILGPIINSLLAQKVNGPNGLVCSEVRNLTAKYMPILLNLEAEGFALFDGPPTPPLPVNEAEQDIVEWENTTGRTAVKINQGLLPLLGNLLNSTIGAEKPDGTVGLDQYYDEIFGKGKPITIPLPDKQISLWNVPYLDYVIRLNATFKSISIGGLDSFSHLELIDIIGDFTVASKVAMNNLVINVTVDVESGAGTLVTGGPVLKDTITISFGVKNLTLLAQTLIGLDQQALDRVTFYGLRTKPLACLLGVLIKDPSRLSTPGIKFNQFEAIIGDGDFTIEGTVSAGLDNALRGLGGAFAKALRRPVLQTIPKIGQDVLRPILNPVIAILIVNAAANAGDCPTPP